MGRNLKYQFCEAINSCFTSGADKHALKSERGLGTERIFSHKDKANLIDTSACFSNFLKEKSPEIKKVSQIRAEHLQAFLISKAEAGCSKATIEQYAARFRKLSKIVNARYGIHTDFHCEMPEMRVPGKVRIVAMRREDLKVICNRGRDSPSKNAVLLTAECGLRVESLVRLQARDVDLDKKILYIHKDKGGRSRSIKLNDEAIALLKKLCVGRNPKQYLFPGKSGQGHICAGTVNKFLRDNARRCGITRYAEAKTGIHCIRKMHAQELYHKCLRDGMTEEESLWVVTRDLGHCSLRMDVLKAYLITEDSEDI